MRRLLVLALAVMMVLAMVPTVALAEELPKEEGSEVTAASDVSYTIIIPDTVNLGTLKPGGSAWVNFKVSAKNVVLEDGGFIELTARGSGPNGAFRLYDQGGVGSNAMSYQLISPYGSPVEPDGRYAKITKSGQYYGKVGTSSADIKFAGSYKGIMTFTISYQGPIKDQSLLSDRNGLIFTAGGGVDIQFASSDWKIKDLDSIEFTTYKGGVKVVSASLNMDYYREKAGSLDKTSVNCPFVDDDYWDITYGAASPDADGILAKVVRNGITYFFTGPTR